MNPIETLTQQWTAFANQPGIVTIFVICTSVLLAVILHLIIFYLLRRALLRRESDENVTTWHILLGKTQRVTRLIFILLAIEVARPLVQLTPAGEVFLSRLVTLGIIGAIGWMAILVTQALTHIMASRYRIDVEDNLEARKMRTRLRVFRQIVCIIIVGITIASMLMSFPGARSLGLSIFASAGVAGIVVGFAARPVLSNLLAGLQIALTQPIRIEDAVVIEGEWGWIEEITPTYVVVKIWDWRRLIVPLSYFIEHPFQNWTRETASIIGNVLWRTDYSVPVDVMRDKLKEFLQASPHWDGKVQVLQVIECHADTIELRALMSARNSPIAWDLRCEIREKMIVWLQANYPHALPRRRAEIEIHPHDTVSPTAVKTS